MNQGLNQKIKKKSFHSILMWIYEFEKKETYMHALILILAHLWYKVKGKCRQYYNHTTNDLNFKSSP